jgi:hypothetical protein
MTIDTFSSDVTISSNAVDVENITTTAYTSAKTVTFVDSSDVVVLVLEIPAGETLSWPSASPPGDRRNGMRFDNGLVLDVNASELVSGDYMFVWVKK